jgi:SAM-dependent methyltransferase
MDRAGQRYWDSLWHGQAVPPAVDPTDHRLGNSVKLAFHEVFREQFASLPPGASILEAGCARSTWLPYFAIHHALAVGGLDYSKEGCEQARSILAREGVTGEIIEADMFDPPADWVGRFDVVISFGLVEHFSDTSSAVAALAEYLKPGGLMITVIPNMGRSVVGWLQRMLDRRVFDVHVPLDRRQLAAAHTGAGLRLESCRYFMAWNWSVVNISDWQDPRRLRLASRIQSAASKLGWALERRGLRIRPNRATSPYILAIARRVGGDNEPGDTRPATIAATPGS